MKVKLIKKSNFFDVDATLVVAPSSTFKYYDKERKDYKKLGDLDGTAELVVQTIEATGQTNVIFGGLEWGDSVPDLIEIVKLLDKDKYSCIFETGYPVDEFLSKIGRYAVDTNEFPEALHVENDDEVVLIMMGQTVLDYITNGTYIVVKVAHKKEDSEQLYLFSEDKQNGHLH